MNRYTPEETGPDDSYFQAKFAELCDMPLQEFIQLVVERWPNTIEDRRDGIAEYIAQQMDDDRLNGVSDD